MRSISVSRPICSAPSVMTIAEKISAMKCCFTNRTLKQTRIRNTRLNHWYHFGIFLQPIVPRQQI